MTKPETRIVVTVTRMAGTLRDERVVKRVARETFLALKRRGAVDVFLVGKEESRKLNRAFRSKRVPATVLSFGASPKFPQPSLGGIPYRGEIYLAPLVIRSRGETLPRYVVHGLLHLFGYTHRGKRDTMEMEALESRLLRGR